MLDWLVIGGGIHGTHLALTLRRKHHVPAHKIRILDPFPQLLAQWDKRTQNVGMCYLRSSSVHHIDISPRSLRRYAAEHWSGSQAPYLAPYDRPALALFQQHCQWVIRSHALNILHLQARCTGLHDGDTHMQAETTLGPLRSRRVLLALGAPEPLCWPAWTHSLRGSSPNIAHVLDPDFSLALWAQRTTMTVAVVGGGISAIQSALALVAMGHTTHLYSPHPIRPALFDADPGWISPFKYMPAFLQEKNQAQRRALIRSARALGTVPPHLLEALSVAQAQGTIHLHIATIDGLNSPNKKAGVPQAHRSFALRLAPSPGCPRQVHHVDAVLLATGFAPTLTLPSWLANAAHALGLARSNCGFPIPSPSLQWHPRLLVTGALAELELGPIARNIPGARRAAERLDPSL